MNLQIAAPKIGLTPSLENYVRTKIKKLDSHFSIVSAHVRLESDVHHKVAQIDLGIPGRQLHLEKRHPDMHVAIDNVIDSAFETLSREKSKVVQKKRTP